MRLLLLVLLLLLSCGDSSATVQETPFDEAVEQRVGSTNFVIDYQYDAENNLTSIDRVGAVTTVRWDRLHRPTLVTDARTGQASLGWSASDQLATFTDPRGLTTSLAHDGFDQLRESASPDTGERSSRFDEAGNLVATRDARGVEARFSWDALNRKTRAVYSAAGAPELRFDWSYDDDDAGTGTLASTSFPEGTSRLRSDGEGRVIEQVQVVGALESRVAYRWSVAGRLASLLYPSGRTVELDVDAGALVVVLDGGARRLLERLDSTETEGLERWDWPLTGGARAHEVRRDNAGRVSAYPLGDTMRTLTWDRANRIVGYTHANSPELDETFAYDALDRLVGFTWNGTSVAVTFDANGNRIAAGPVTWAVDPASNRLERALGDAGVHEAFTFDPAGHLSSTRALTLETDLAGRLASITRGGVTTRSTYDAMGLRVRKVSGTVDLTFVYDVKGHLLGEYLQTGEAVREYVWLDDTLVAFFAGAELLFVECDHLGAPRVAFDVAGTVRWRWRSRPFGEDAPDSAPTGLAPITLPLRFPGQYADDESGFFYNHFRDYDPATGRYLQPDPLGLAGGPNRYVYVENNPVSLVDPEGLTPTDKWFGHTDPGFQRWWHTHPLGKESGWFSSSDEGFNSKKPLDIPNKKAADGVRDYYEELKRSGQLDDHDECKRQRRVDRARRGFRRGGGRGLE